MTDVSDKTAPNENGTEEATEMEDESDAGSDIFMPGGITMKAADELPDGTIENEDKDGAKDSNNENTELEISKTESTENDMSIDEDPVRDDCRISEEQKINKECKLEQKEKAEDDQQRADNKNEGIAEKEDTPKNTVESNDMDQKEKAEDDQQRADNKKDSIAEIEDTPKNTDESNDMDQEKKAEDDQQRADNKKDSIAEIEDTPKKTDEHNDSIDDDKQSVDSPSSCLEINIDDESAFPRSNKEKIINSVHNKEKDDIFDERNIFMNSEIFDKNKEALQASEDNSSKKEVAQSDDEHNMSDDFKIGLNQKSYEEDPFCPDKPRPYETIETNAYLIDKKKSRSSKEDRYMQCECPFEPDDPHFVGCDDDCLNRLLMIECSAKTCPTGEFCTNRNFQRGSVFDLEVFKAGKKGWGLRTNEEIQKGSFVMEYCGEVVDNNDFQRRTQIYHDDGISHFYFMTLKQNEVIDATRKGSKSRFINHSCDPNCETQKWTVNGFLRVGFFALHHIYPGEELSFDYQFQRYGDEPQECHCGADNCRGVIGSEQVSSIPSYFEKIMADSPSRSEKKKKKFQKSELAEELTECFGRTWELEKPKQTLELLRLMVKVETTKERIVLMKILQVSKNSAALNAFVHYKGLSLLWSWMVDAPETKSKYKIEILKTLKHIPVPSRNELDDSKLETIVQKWSTTKVGDDDTTTGKSSRTSSTDDNNSNTASGSDNDVKNDEGNSSQDESSKEDNEDREKLNKTCESVEEGEILDESELGASNNEEDRKSKKKKKKQKDDKESSDTLSKAARREEKIASLSMALIDEWKQLKEVFKIPKKIQTPDRRPRQDGGDDSPLPNDEKKSLVSTPIQRVATSEGQSPSSPGNARHPSHSARPNEESSELSTDDQTDDKPRSPNHSSSRSSRRRDWRKSPEYRDSNDKSYDDREKSQDDGDSRSGGKKWNSRWGRDRRNSFDRDRDRDRGSRWNNESDSQSRWGRNNRNNYSAGGGGGGGGGNWNERNNWNDRNNQGGRNGNNRDNLNNRMENRTGGMTDNNTWSSGIAHWTAPLRPMQPPPPQPPGTLPMPPHQQFRDPRVGPAPPMMNIDQIPGPPIGFPRMINPIQPPSNMVPMNMLQNPNMIPPPIPPPNPISIVMQNQLNAVNQQKSMSLHTSMSSASQPFNPVSMTNPMANHINPPPPLPPYNPSGADVNTLSVVNQLLLLNAERLKQATGGGTSHSSTPDNNTSSRLSAPASPHRNSSTSSPTRSKPLPTLPTHWKTATDADGRVYYYHTTTRETSWDPPIALTEDRGGSSPKRPKKTNSENRYSPVRHSPRIAAADTTHKSGPRTPPSSSSSSVQQAAEMQKIRDTFKSKISSVVVNCLNSYQKVDCKQGRIKNTDDFKFLARKLTHGLIMKERQRIGNADHLSCNDSVKLKVKEYIRNYMKKFGSVYIRS